MYGFIAPLPKSCEVNTEICYHYLYRKGREAKKKLTVSPKVSWLIRNRVVLELGQIVAKAQDLKCFFVKLSLHIFWASYVRNGKMAHFIDEETEAQRGLPVAPGVCALLIMLCSFHSTVYASESI